MRKVFAIKQLSLRTNTTSFAYQVLLSSTQEWHLMDLDATMSDIAMNNMQNRSWSADYR